MFERIVLLPWCVLWLCVSGALSYLFSLVSSYYAVRFRAMDQPTGGRKIHLTPVPLWGGVGIAVTVFVVIGVFLFLNGLRLDGAVNGRQLVGFALGIFLLLVGGMLDDRWPQPAITQVFFPVVASLCVWLTGTSISHVTSLSGGSAFSLAWWSFPSLHVVFPADLLTITWLMFAMYTTKLLDGLDGLVTGMAVIGSGMVSALSLSTRYFQPDIALLASGIGGAFLGFLPRNTHPAKQFLGETGSTLAGFSLGFLAIVSGAKVAITLAVLAIPLADAIVVVLGRIRRGVSPWKGDDTHLHFRLLKAGMPHRTVVLFLWSLSFGAGVIALFLQTRGKIFLLGSLMLVPVVASWILRKRLPLRADSPPSSFRQR